MLLSVQEILRTRCKLKRSICDGAVLSQMQYIQNLLFYSRKAQIEAPQSLVLCNWTAEYNFFQIYSLNYFTYMSHQGWESLWYLLEAAFTTRFNFAPLYPLLHRLNWNWKKTPGSIVREEAISTTQKLGIMLLIKIFRNVNLIKNPHVNTSLSSINFSLDHTNQILSIFILIGFTVILSGQARCTQMTTKYSSHMFPTKIR